MNNVVESADVLARMGNMYVLIERLTSQKGLALPGGKKESGENAPITITREFKEETGLILSALQFFKRYEGRERDLRFPYSITDVFVGTATGFVTNEVGKTKVHLMTVQQIMCIPEEYFAFDHYKIIHEVFAKTEKC